MSEAAEFIDWQELREFKAVDLLNSFVLSWSVESETLIIDVDLGLTPDHAFYEKPRREGEVCIHPAVIEFPNCDSLRHNGSVKSAPAKGVTLLGHGEISGLRRYNDGDFEIEGAFGTVHIESERPLLRLKSA